ncbi:transcription factor bHLH30-like isoform X2 [Primulina huaijiensis]|uniref:transcription factor bHLH30-like isoform X2 n=1 Tax=Primulina huaijiensis TaxID=1492673 RepID=UPI003CC77D1D
MDFCDNFDGFSDNCFGFREVSKEGSSLALYGKRGELVKALVKPGRKVNGAENGLLALRNHSAAERRRRERINGHLTTLRGLIPGTAKMDKAALLAEVINQVKKLRDHVTEVTRGTLVPTDIDELKVVQEGKNDDNSFSIRASLCCDFKTELLSNIREAIEALPLKAIRAEIATLGSRMVNVFVIAGCNPDEEGSKFLVDSVRKTLRSVLDKFYASEEFASRNTMSGSSVRFSIIKGIGE